MPKKRRNIQMLFFIHLFFSLFSIFFSLPARVKLFDADVTCPKMLEISEHEPATEGWKMQDLLSCILSPRLFQRQFAISILVETFEGSLASKDFSAAISVQNMLCILFPTFSSLTLSLSKLMYLSFSGEKAQHPLGKRANNFFPA